jgi:hypothetical protein
LYADALAGGDEIFLLERPAPKRVPVRDAAEDPSIDRIVAVIIHILLTPALQDDRQVTGKQDCQADDINCSK